MPSMTCCTVCQEEGLSLGTAVPVYRQYSHGRWDVNSVYLYMFPDGFKYIIMIITIIIIITIRRK